MTPNRVMLTPENVTNSGLTRLSRISVAKGDRGYMGQILEKIFKFLNTKFNGF